VASFDKARAATSRSWKLAAAPTVASTARRQARAKAFSGSPVAGLPWTDNWCTVPTTPPSLGFALAVDNLKRTMTSGGVSFAA